VYAKLKRTWELFVVYEAVLSHGITALTNDVEESPSCELCVWRLRVSGRSGDDPWRRKFGVDIDSAIGGARRARERRKQVSDKARRDFCFAYVAQRCSPHGRRVRGRALDHLRACSKPALPCSSNSDLPSTNPKATRGRGLRPFQQWWWAWRAFLQGVVTEMTDAHGRCWSRQQHGFRRLRQAIPAVKRARTTKGPRERSLESA
jgi:hypothetical protein